MLPPPTIGQSVPLCGTVRCTVCTVHSSTSWKKIRIRLCREFWCQKSGKWLTHSISRIFFWVSGHSESVSCFYFVCVVFTLRHWCFLAYWNVGAEPIQIITHRHLHRNGIKSAESQSWHLCCRLFQDAAIKIWVWNKVLSQPRKKMYLAEAGTYRPEGVGGGSRASPAANLTLHSWTLTCKESRLLALITLATCSKLTWHHWAKSHTIKNELLNRHISIQQVTNQAVNQQKRIFQKVIQNWSAHHIQVLLEYDDFLIFKFLIL